MYLLNDGNFSVPVEQRTCSCAYQMTDVSPYLEAEVAPAASHPVECGRRHDGQAQSAQRQERALTAHHVASGAAIVAHLADAKRPLRTPGARRRASGVGVGLWYGRGAIAVGGHDRCGGFLVPGPRHEPAERQESPLLFSGLVAACHDHLSQKRVTTASERFLNSQGHNTSRWTGSRQPMATHGYRSPHNLRRYAL